MIKHPKVTCDLSSPHEIANIAEALVCSEEQSHSLEPQLNGFNGFIEWKPIETNSDVEESRRALHCVLDGEQTISSRLAQTVRHVAAMSSCVLHRFTACCMLYSASAFACAKSMASGMQKTNPPGFVILVSKSIKIVSPGLLLFTPGMESKYHWNLLEENCGQFQDFQILQQTRQNIGSARFCRLAGDVHSRCIRFNIHDLHLPQSQTRVTDQPDGSWRPAYQSLLPIPWSLHGSMMPLKTMHIGSV